jgi:hypothetical protein
MQNTPYSRFLFKDKYSIVYLVYKTEGIFFNANDDLDYSWRRWHAEPVLARIFPPEPQLILRLTRMPSWASNQDYHILLHLQFYTNGTTRTAVRSSRSVYGIPFLIRTAHFGASYIEMFTDYATWHIIWPLGDSQLGSHYRFCSDVTWPFAIFRILKSPLWTSSHASSKSLMKIMQRKCSIF